MPILLEDAFGCRPFANCPVLFSFPVQTLETYVKLNRSHHFQACLVVVAKWHLKLTFSRNQKYLAPSRSFIHTLAFLFPPPYGTCLGPGIYTSPWFHNQAIWVICGYSLYWRFVGHLIDSIFTSRTNIRPGGTSFQVDRDWGYKESTERCSPRTLRSTRRERAG